MIFATAAAQLRPDLHRFRGANNVVKYCERQLHISAHFLIIYLDQGTLAVPIDLKFLLFRLGYQGELCEENLYNFFSINFTASTSDLATPAKKPMDCIRLRNFF
jgi:hypothetical protein